MKLKIKKEHEYLILEAIDLQIRTLNTKLMKTKSPKRKQEIDMKIQKLMTTRYLYYINRSFDQTIKWIRKTI